MNTKIEYLYRDADNYKVWNECVVEGCLTEAQKQQILACRFEGEWFIPSMVGLPGKQFDEWDDPVDHPYFELYDHSFEETELAPTVAVKAQDLVAAFERCKEAKWMETPVKNPTLSELLAAAEAKKADAGAVEAPVRHKENER